MNQCPCCYAQLENGLCGNCGYDACINPAPTREETVATPAPGSVTLLAVAEEARAMAKSYRRLGFQMVTYKSLADAFEEFAMRLERAAASQNAKLTHPRPDASDVR